MPSLRDGPFVLLLPSPSRKWTGCSYLLSDHWWPLVVSQSRRVVAQPNHPTHQIPVGQAQRSWATASGGNSVLSKTLVLNTLTRLLVCVGCSLLLHVFHYPCHSSYKIVIMSSAYNVPDTDLSCLDILCTATLIPVL